MNFGFGEVGVNIFSFFLFLFLKIFSFYINKNLILHKFNLGLNAYLSILKVQYDQITLKSIKFVS